MQLQQQTPSPSSPSTLPLINALNAPLVEVLHRQKTDEEENRFFSLLMEAKKAEKEVRRSQHHPLWLRYVAVSVLLLSFVYIYAMRHFHGGGGGGSLFIWIGPFLSIISRKERVFKEKAKTLLPYNDMRAVGVLTHLAGLTLQKTELKEILNLLHPLLQSFTRDDIIYFTPLQEAALRGLAQNRQIWREYPDVLEAILVTLYKLGSEENKAFLAKMAKQKMPREENAWIPRAAQACLDLWLV